MKSERMPDKYDLCSAITFLLIGLGFGAVWAMVFNPKTKQEMRPEGMNSRPTLSVQAQEEARERVA